MADKHTTRKKSVRPDQKSQNQQEEKPLPTPARPEFDQITPAELNSVSQVSLALLSLADLLRRSDSLRTQGLGEIAEVLGRKLEDVYCEVNNRGAEAEREGGAE